ncbi:MAG: ATP-binding cassette domain-containing protein, partial [Candidatus Krumholzibacteriota bacterium]|nr:ATP-binding cassette domain-containing protein [Candidatus Krumholzibacteriota bacterium]
MLKVERLSKSIGRFSLHDLSLEVARGEYFVLLGASGMGKTVLLEMITGMREPDGGTICLEGKDITRQQMQKRDIGLVFQNQALFPHLSVRQNIEYGMRSLHFTRSRINQRMEELCEQLDVTSLLDRKPGTLSGGEAQRVALARALAVRPRCLLLDEPLCSLDTSVRAEMRALLRRLNRSGITMLHVTHDYEEAISLATRVGIMERGTIVQIDSPPKIFQYPKSEFVARFVGIRNFFPGRIVRADAGDAHGAEFVSAGVRFRTLTDSGEGEGS